MLVVVHVRCRGEAELKEEQTTGRTKAAQINHALDNICRIVVSPRDLWKCLDSRRGLVASRLEIRWGRHRLRTDLPEVPSDAKSARDLFGGGESGLACGSGQLIAK